MMQNKGPSLQVTKYINLLTPCIYDFSHTADAIDSRCGGPRLLTALTGTLSTMNYGNATNPLYENSTLCSWHIQAPTDWVRLATFRGFILRK